MKFNLTSKYNSCMYSYKREKEGDKARKVRATNRLDEDSWKFITKL